MLSFSTSWHHLHRPTFYILWNGCYLFAFFVGLLGGAVYVHGYKRICIDFPIIAEREFALASASVAESLGVVMADVSGLFLQACLYKINNIDGAVVPCSLLTN
mmetsp:Transcript_338/g.499  ORF Transcript_338/g.499 Transcript_338/m.499 type:complete len:103 (-) Transcript_338:43-351(-)